MKALGDGVTMDLVLIPDGDFLMGDSDIIRSPRRKVHLDGFYMQTTLVTVAQYQAYCKAKGLKMPQAPNWGWIGSHPMVNVSFFDAQKFCEWLSEKSGRQIRMPKEEEWEKAARGTQGRKFP